MDDEDVEHIESEEQFWEEIEDIASTPCRTHDRIDDTLRTWIATITRYREDYVHSETDVSKCVTLLRDGSLFSQHADYVRRQLIYALLQEDEPTTLHLIITYLTTDGRAQDACFELLAAEGGFARLVDLIRRGVDDEKGCHRHMLVLLYEMSRIQRVSRQEIGIVDDTFILYLFGIIESLSGDVRDPYHYPTIRVLLVLNEQYMVSTQSSGDDGTNGQVLTNRVIKVLSTHGNVYKTFGENIILLLNRESETSLQLLILKFLYLLFTTPSTYEYFYTNDLHVLVDILIRNLLDLPPDISGSANTTSLRHTYLRVLHPLMAHTQLAHPPHYKRNELRKLLLLLADVGHTHFEQPDETTIRLVGRCLGVTWLREEQEQEIADLQELRAVEQLQSIAEQVLSPVQVGQAAVAKKLIGISLPEAQESAISINEVAMQQAKPGVDTPSRSRGFDADALQQDQPLGEEVSRTTTTTSDDASSQRSGQDPFEG